MTERTQRRVLEVPSSALRRDNGRDVVFVVADGKVERRAVTVDGIADPGTGRSVVLAGLSAGEQVVVEGPEDLADGDAVRVR